MSNHQILNPADHAALRVHTGAGAQFGDAVMACLAVPLEFRAVQAHYPIVFRRDAASGQFSALAMFGFDNGENLFLDGDRWDARYRPLAMAIQPFLIGRPPEGSDTPQVHIDMAHPRVSHDGEGTRLFDEDGRPTPIWKRWPGGWAIWTTATASIPPFSLRWNATSCWNPSRWMSRWTTARAIRWSAIT